MGFGAMLKALREEAGLSQEALAERSGLNLRSIQNWEQEHRSPRVEHLPRLARALGVPLERLVSGLVQAKMAEAARPRRRRPGRGRARK